MESITRFLGIAGLVIFSLGVLFVVIDFLLPKKFKTIIDQYVEELWLRIDPNKVGTAISAYSRWMIRLYSPPLPPPKRREYIKGRKIRARLSKRIFLIIFAFTLPVLALVLIHTNIKDNFILFNMPNYFDQYYTISGNLSIIAACGIVNLLIYQTLEKIFSLFVRTTNLKGLWLIAAVAMILLAFIEPILTIFTSLLFHVFFSFEIFFFPNIPPVYLWNPDLSPARLASFQGNPEIFVFHARLFYEETKTVFVNILPLLIYMPNYLVAAFRAGMYNYSTFLVDMSSSLLGYLPLLPVILYLMLVTILLIIKYLIILTSKLLESITKRIIDRKITEEENREKSFSDRIEIEPTLKFIGVQLMSFSTLIATPITFLSYLVTLIVK